MVGVQQTGIKRYVLKEVLPVIKFCVLKISFKWRAVLDVLLSRFTLRAIKGKLHCGYDQGYIFRSIKGRLDDLQWRVQFHLQTIFRLLSECHEWSAAAHLHLLASGHAAIFVVNAELVASRRQHRIWTVSLHPPIIAEDETEQGTRVVFQASNPCNTRHPPNQWFLTRTPVKNLWIPEEMTNCFLSILDAPTTAATFWLMP